MIVRTAFQLISWSSVSTNQTIGRRKEEESMIQDWIQVLGIWEEEPKTPPNEWSELAQEIKYQSLWLTGGDNPGLALDSFVL